MYVLIWCCLTWFACFDCCGVLPNFALLFVIGCLVVGCLLVLVVLNVWLLVVRCLRLDCS